MPPDDRPVNSVFQHFAQFPHLTVARKVGIAVRLLRRPQAEIAATVARMVELVGLEGMEHRRPDQLSGGQKQRVAFARETGITFVFVTHDQDKALAMSDRIAVMQGGRVQQLGRPEEICEAPANRFVADFIDGANLIPARIRAQGAPAERLGVGAATGGMGPR